MCESISIAEMLADKVESNILVGYLYCKKLPPNQDDILTLVYKDLGQARSE